VKTKIYSVILALGCLMVMSICSIATYAGNVVRIVGDEEKSVPKYEETKYNATLKDYNYDAAVAGAGIAKPIDGNIGEFLIQDVKLTMKKKKFESGAIETKELGKVRILFSSSLAREGFIALLTKEQLKQLEGLLPKEAVSAAASAGQATAPQASVFKTEQDKVSYIIGTQIAQSIKKQGVEVNLEPLMLGLQDVLEGNTLKLTKAETQKVFAAFQQRMRAKQEAERKIQADENLAKGKAFLEANKTKEGVKVLPSGLQYKVIKEGTGEIPTADDKVKTHYRGRLLDGTEFDSSYKRNQPAEFPVKGVIKGWTEALQLMKTGAKWELYIPADLAYGERGRPSIPPNSVLIFEIELLEIVK